MQDFTDVIYARCMALAGHLKKGIQMFLFDEQGDVNIVSMVVLIAIAVILAILFRNQIEAILKGLFQNIQSSINEATGAAGGTGP